MIFFKTIVLAPPAMGRQKLDLFLAEQAAGYQVHSNTELEGCRKVKQEEFECGGAKSRFLPKIDDFCKTIVPDAPFGCV